MRAAIPTRIPCTVCHGAGTCMLCDDNGMVPAACPDCAGWLDQHEPECVHYVEPAEECDAIGRAEWRAEENWRDG